MSGKIIQQDDFEMRAPAYLLVEGAGIHGSFEFCGTVTLRQNAMVHISAKGFTPATTIAQKHGGSVEFYAHAFLKRNNNTVKRVTLKRSNEPVAWNESKFTPIGTGTLSIPKEPSNTAYSVVIKGGYFYDTGSGLMQPVPSTTTTTIQLNGLN